MNRTGLSAHIGSIWGMMSRANCEDGVSSDACNKSLSLETLSNEIVEEMETEHLHVLIQEAVVRDNYLLVVNKANRLIRVNFNQVPALANLPFRDRRDFEIQENGSCLYWASTDTHIDFEALLYYVDLDYQAKVGKETAEHNRRYGKAIEIVRTAYQISVDGIEGLEPNEVKDIEAGCISARASILCLYSTAIGISLDDFLEKIAVNLNFLKTFEAT